MAAYVKHGDQIVLSLSKAEAEALLNVVISGEDRRAVEDVNHQKARAANRAARALETACNPSSRTGATIN